MADAFDVQQEMSQKVKHMLSPQSWYYTSQMIGNMWKKLQEMRVKKLEAQVGEDGALILKKDALCEKGLGEADQKLLAAQKKELGELNAIDPKALTEANKERITELNKSIKGLREKGAGALTGPDKALFDSLNADIKKLTGKLNKIKGAGMPGVLGVVQKVVKMLCKLICYVHPVFYLLPKGPRERMLAFFSATEKGHKKHIDNWTEHQKSKGRIDENNMPIPKEERREAAKQYKQKKKEEKGQGKEADVNKDAPAQENKERTESPGERNRRQRREETKGKKKKKEKMNQEKAKNVKPKKEMKFVRKTKNDIKVVTKQARAASGLKVSKVKEMMLTKSTMKYVKKAQKLLSFGKQNNKAVEGLLKKANENVMRLGGGISFRKKGTDIVSKVVGKRM